MNIKNKILKTFFLFCIIFILFFNLNQSYAYSNNAFSINIPSKYMGKDEISNDNIYGFGEGGNFLFITEENLSKDKIKDIKKDILKYNELEYKLYKKQNIMYKLKVVKINGVTAFKYEPNDEELLYYIPTDNYMIHIQVFSNDEISLENNDELIKILNNIEILDSVDTINYNKNSVIVVNWNLLLKRIIPLVVIGIIILFVIIFVKIRKNKRGI